MHIKQGWSITNSSPFLLTKNFKKMEITTNGKKYMTIKAYASLIGKTERTVYNLIKEKEVVTRDMLGKTLIQVD